MPTRRPPRLEPSNVGLSKHELGIRKLLASDQSISRYGFAKAVDEIVDRFGCADDCRLNGHFIPDAYRIDWANQWIDIFEVVDRCSISARKFGRLADWWEAWDCEEQCDFLPRLFVISDGQMRHLDLSEASVPLSA